MITVRGSRFVIREGGLAGRRAAVILCGAGRTNAAAATEVLIDGHRPRRIISAGFAGGLSPQLKRHDILVANQLLAAHGPAMRLELPASLSAACSRAGVHCGPLLTADHVIRLPGEKQSLFARYGAVAVDMETFAVAEVCLRRQVAFSSIRVINDAAGERLSRDIEHLLSQKTEAARLGAAVGASGGDPPARRTCTSCGKTRWWPPTAWPDFWRKASLTDGRQRIDAQFSGGQTFSSVPSRQAGMPLVGMAVQLPPQQPECLSSHVVSHWRRPPAWC